MSQYTDAELVEKAKIAIQEILVHSDQFSNVECLAKARDFLRLLEEKVKNGSEGLKVP